MPVLRHTLFAAVACASLFPAIARAETVNLTLLFASDLYNVDNTEPRGGFARLNAVVKAERARNALAVSQEHLQDTKADLATALQLPPSAVPEVIGDLGVPNGAPLP